MSAPNQTASNRRGGMANLASNLNSRAESLARRSTEDDIVPEPISPGLAVTPPPPVEFTEAVDAELASPQPTAGDERPARGEPPPVQASRPATRQRKSERAVELPRPMAGPEGRLEASGETVVKWTLELAPQLIMALNVWERDETKRLGQRVFRERMIDLALDSLPEDVESILKVVAELPIELRNAAGQQFGTRVRYSVRDKLLGLRPELRVAGIKNVRIRDIYSAGVYRYLTGLGIAIDPETEKPRNREDNLKSRQ